MGYLEKKAKHAYKCYKKNVPRRKVYSVVEKDGRYLVLWNKPESRFKYSLAGGSIEKRETLEVAIIRELQEEMNINVEFVKKLGSIMTKSKWNYKGKEFEVNDDISVVLTRFVSYSDRSQLGLEGEFEIQDIVVEISREEMIDNVYEFVEGGIIL